MTLFPINRTYAISSYTPDNRRVVPSKQSNTELHGKIFHSPYYYSLSFFDSFSNIRPSLISNTINNRTKKIAETIFNLAFTESQDDITGDGTTSTVLLCGELLRQAERYTSEGLHPRIVTDGYDIARDAALEFLEGFQSNVPIVDDADDDDRELLRCVASTSLRTKLDGDLAGEMTEAVVDAVRCVAQRRTKGENDVEPNARMPVDLNMIEIMAMEKNMGSDSRFVNGLVLDHGGRHPDMPTTLNNVHIMTCNVTFEYEKTEVQSGFFYTNAEEREKLVDSERKWLDHRCKAVVDFKRSVCKDGEVSIWTDFGRI